MTCYIPKILTPTPKDYEVPYFTGCNNQRIKPNTLATLCNDFYDSKAVIVIQKFKSLDFNEETTAASCGNRNLPVQPLFNPV